MRSEAGQTRVCMGNAMVMHVSPLISIPELIDALHPDLFLIGRVQSRLFASVLRYPHITTLHKHTHWLDRHVTWHCSHADQSLLPTVLHSNTPPHLGRGET